MSHPLTVRRLRNEIHRDGVLIVVASSAIISRNGRLDLGSAYRRMAFEDTWCGGWPIVLHLEH